MLLGGVRRTEAELMRNLGPRRRHAGLGNESLDQAQDLGLPGGKVGHFELPVYIYSYCDYIQIIGCSKSPQATANSPAIWCRSLHRGSGTRAVQHRAARLELQLRLASWWWLKILKELCYLPTSMPCSNSNAPALPLQPENSAQMRFQLCT